MDVDNLQSSLLIMAMVFSVLSFVILDSILLNRLRELESSVFKEIGEPSLFVHMSVKYRYWYSFLLLGRFNKYQLSKKTKALCQLNRAFILVVSISLFSWVILVAMYD